VWFVDQEVWREAAGDKPSYRNSAREAGVGLVAAFATGVIDIAAGEHGWSYTLLYAGVAGLSSAGASALITAGLIFAKRFRRYHMLHVGELVRLRRENGTLQQRLMQQVNYTLALDGVQGDRVHRALEVTLRFFEKNATEALAAPDLEDARAGLTDSLGRAMAIVVERYSGQSRPSIDTLLEEAHAQVAGARSMPELRAASAAATGTMHQIGALIAKDVAAALDVFEQFGAIANQEP
jgi:hypothetical protein